MKYIIIQLVNQKQELEEKLTKITFFTKSSILLKPINTKPPALSSPTLKKPSPANPKSNVKYTPIFNPKKALILKIPTFIKFNQIQIENIELENFNTPIPKQDDIVQKEINEIANIEINIPTSKQGEIQIMFSTPKPLPQTSFVASEPLPDSFSINSLLIKRKRLGMSKHKITNKKTSVFTFKKPSFTNLLKFKSIEKPKEIIKKTKPLNKNSKIFEFFFDQNIDNSKNDNKSIQQFTRHF
jgi:hypothetical protein